MPTLTILTTRRTPVALSTLGWVYYRLGKFDLADKVFLMAVKAFEKAKTPVDPDTITYAAHLLVQQGRDSEAKEVLQKLVKSDRKFPMRPEAMALFEKVKDGLRWSIRIMESDHMNAIGLRTVIAMRPLAILEGENLQRSQTRSPIWLVPWPILPAAWLCILLVTVSTAFITLAGLGITALFQQHAGALMAAMGLTAYGVLRCRPSARTCSGRRSRD